MFQLHWIIASCIAWFYWLLFQGVNRVFKKSASPTTGRPGLHPDLTAKLQERDCEKAVFEKKRKAH